MSPEMCVLWVASDVLMCSASIWHMCTMSMDRYFTLSYPMRYGRNKTRRMVAGKILFVWVVSMAIALPICIYGFVDSSIVYNNGACVPVLKNFIILGSIFAFYIPLLIMLVTYILTIRILWRNEQRMQQIDRSDLKPRLAQLTAQCTGLAIPKLVASLRRSTRGGSKKVAALRPGAYTGQHVQHVQSQSNPSLAMYATENRLADSRGRYSPLVKKCVSQPKFGLSVSFFKDSQFIFSKKDGFANQNGNSDSSELTLTNSLDSLKIKEASRSVGMTYLRPPSSLTHSVVSTSPLSSPSTLNSSLPSPYACDESDDYREEEGEDYDSGDGVRYLRQLKPPVSPSSPLSSSGSHRSLHRRLQRRQLYLSQQREALQVRNSASEGQPQQQQQQQPPPQENEHYELKEQHNRSHALNHSCRCNKCVDRRQVGQCDGQNKPQCPADSLSDRPPHSECWMETGTRDSLTGTRKCHADTVSPRQICGDPFPAECARISLSSSASSPSISVFYDGCAEDRHNNTPDCVKQHLMSCSGVCKEVTRTRSHPASPIAAALGSNRNLSQSQITNTKKKSSKFENSPNGSLRKKRFSKRSKKKRTNMSGCEKRQKVPERDPLVSVHLEHSSSSQPAGFLQVPKQLSRHQGNRAGMTAAVSDTHVSHAGRDGQIDQGSDRGGTRLSSTPLGNMRSNLDYKSMEWDRRYFQVMIK